MQVKSVYSALKLTVMMDKTGSSVPVAIGFMKIAWKNYLWIPLVRKDFVQHALI